MDQNNTLSSPSHSRQHGDPDHPGQKPPGEQRDPKPLAGSDLGHTPHHFIGDPEPGELVIDPIHLPGIDHGIPEWGMEEDPGPEIQRVRHN